MNKKFINHITNSIFNASLENSKLSYEILSIPGFSSHKGRHLLNNLMNYPNINYLEIGVFKGSTFISSLYNNNLNSAYSIDNFSQFLDYGDIKKEFLEYTSKYLNNNFEFFDVDCFQFDKSNIKHKINAYLFDGDHTSEAQYKALEYYYDVLDDEFMLIVDDFDWKDVENGTRDAISKLNLYTQFETHLRSNKGNDEETWWNGLYIAVLNKQ